MSSYSLSLISALLININIVIGCAFFLGAGAIAHSCGAWAPLAWLSCGLLLAPLIAALAYFAHRYPQAGGLYWYTRNTLGPWWGFLSGWGYFIGTAAGNAALLKAFAANISAIPCLVPYITALHAQGLSCEIICVVVFSLCSVGNMLILERLQLGFTILKTIPFIALLCALFCVGSMPTIPPFTASISAIWATLPTALFAYIGIEACCSVIDKIDNPERNGFRLLVMSFLTIMSIYAFFQWCLVLVGTPTATDPFLTLLSRVCSNPTIITWGNALIYTAITASLLGGFYGVFYFNNWHLHELANNKLILGSSLLRKLNRSHAPWVCVLFQGLFICSLLLFASELEYLYAMSDFGVIIAYILTAIAFACHKKTILSLSALVSCCVLLYCCTQSLLHASLWNIVPFISMLIIGCISYYVEHHYNS